MSYLLNNDDKKIGTIFIVNNPLMFTVRDRFVELYVVEEISDVITVYSDKRSTPLTSSHLNSLNGVQRFCT